MMRLKKAFSPVVHHGISYKMNRMSWEIERVSLKYPGAEKIRAFYKCYRLGSWGYLKIGKWNMRFKSFH